MCLNSHPPSSPVRHGPVAFLPNAVNHFSLIGHRRTSMHVRANVHIRPDTAGSSEIIIQGWVVSAAENNKNR